MSTPSGVAVRSSAYAKMILHGMKHPQDSVCGLLIGYFEASCSEQVEVVCADSVPLLHTHMLHPQLRLGVELVETLCAHDTSGGASPLRAGKCKQQIVGIYHADVLSAPQKQSAVNKEVVHIARILQQHYPQLLVCTQSVLRESRTGASCASILPQFWLSCGSSWKKMPDDAILCTEAAIQVAEKAVADAMYLDLIDLDDHLNDPRLSPLNPFLLTKFEGLIAEDAKRLDDRVDSNAAMK
ncbi:hypothetical protein Esti_005128 [Eimeria stiedai]